MKKLLQLFFFLGICIWSLSVGVCATEGNAYEKKAVVFVLDASNSMNSNDRDRLAKDSIAQLIYSLPSNYMVGFVAYHTDVASSVEMVDNSGRDSIMEAANSVRYTGYTNAGAGLTRAVELLSTVDATEKTVVMLSDGEIIMANDEATIQATNQFQTAVSQAGEKGISIHVIGLGSEMENSSNTIFSASEQTNGRNYHAPKAEDIQSTVDSILLEQLHIKNTSFQDLSGKTSTHSQQFQSLNEVRRNIKGLDMVHESVKK